MEKVQFQLEATLPELKDLEEKGLFSKAELKQITKRRTRFETALIKRVAKKEDFLAYAEYERGVEALRRVRYKRLGLDKAGTPRSISSYSIPRRVTYILRRATQKFSYDIAVWLAYVDHARSEKMTKVVQSGLTSALQLHPQSALLYILLSHHYLHPLSPPPIATSSFATAPSQTPRFSIEGVSSARTTLLLGLRMAPTNQDLWREYIKLEIGWVEALRRRWRALGIEDIGGGKDKMDADVQDGLPSGDQDMDGDDMDFELGRGAFGATGEPARQAIIRGDLIVTVMRSALTRPAHRMDEGFHQSLVRMLRAYPTGLRLRLLEVVYESMEGIPSVSAQLALRTRRLYDEKYDPEAEDLVRTDEERGFPLEEEEEEVVVQGEKLVAALGQCVKDMQVTPPVLAEADDEEGSAWSEGVGLWLLQWMGRASGNVALRRFLAAALEARTKRSASPTARLLASHLEYLLGESQADGASAASIARVDKLAKSYLAMHPTSPSLWMARLEAASRAEDGPEVGALYIQAMSAVGSAPGASDIWLGAMRWFDAHVNGAMAASGSSTHWEQTLKAARKLVHDSGRKIGPAEQLYADLLLEWTGITTTAAIAVDRLTSAEWDVPYVFWPEGFVTLTARPDIATHHVQRLYKSWHKSARTFTEQATAVLAWAEYALHHQASRQAYDEVHKVKREIEGDTLPRSASKLEDQREKQAAVTLLERRWAELVEGARAPKASVGDAASSESVDEDEE